MRKRSAMCAIALVTGLAVALGAAPLWAEDSGVFKNSAGYSQAQDRLVAEGYLATGSFTPGVMDESTRKALSEYQEVHSLNSDGILDDDTYQMLTSHEMAYPWGGDEMVAAAEPQIVEPAPEPMVAEAPPVPEPTPDPVVVKEAPAPPVAAAEPARGMPATGSSLPLLALTGLALLGGGALLLRQRAA